MQTVYYCSNKQGRSKRSRIAGEKQGRSRRAEKELGGSKGEEEQDRKVEGA